MKTFLVLIFLVFFAGCVSIDGVGDVASDHYENIDQSAIEKQLTKGTELEDDNLSVVKSIIEAAENLKRLQAEMESLQGQIEEVNMQLKELSENETLIINEENREYLNYLNDLVESSMVFSSALRDSVYIWDSYLSSTDHDVTNIKDVNSSGLADSIINPMQSMAEEMNQSN